MTATYEKIATTTLGSAQTTINFNSITGSYTDLILICNVKQDTDSTVYMRFNADTAAIVGLWRSTSAINAIEIWQGGDGFSSGSTFTLYGIKAE
jgi:hypothetical protein